MVFVNKYSRNGSPFYLQIVLSCVAGNGAIGRAMPELDFFSAARELGRKLFDITHRVRPCPCNLKTVKLGCKLIILTAEF